MLLLCTAGRREVVRVSGFEGHGPSWLTLRSCEWKHVDIAFLGCGWAKSTVGHLNRQWRNTAFFDILAVSTSFRTLFSCSVKDTLYTWMNTYKKKHYQNTQKTWCQHFYSTSSLTAILSVCALEASTFYFYTACWRLDQDWLQTHCKVTNHALGPPS